MVWSRINGFFVRLRQVRYTLPPVCCKQQVMIKRAIGVNTNHLACQVGQPSWALQEQARLESSFMTRRDTNTGRTINIMPGSVMPSRMLEHNSWTRTGTP